MFARAWPIGTTALWIAVLLTAYVGFYYLDGDELKRKALHVGVGLAALTFPLLLETPTATLGALGLVSA